MKDLIAKLEAATGPSRALNVDICEAVSDYSKEFYRQWCGLQPKGSSTTIRDFLRDRLSSSYTGSLTDARRLVPSDCNFAVGDAGPDDSPYACVTRGSTDYAASAATPELALCIAALRARDGGMG